MSDANATDGRVDASANLGGRDVEGVNGKVDADGRDVVDERTANEEVRLVVGGGGIGIDNDTGPGTGTARVVSASNRDAGDNSS